MSMVDPGGIEPHDAGVAAELGEPAAETGTVLARDWCASIGVMASPLTRIAATGAMYRHLVTNVVLPPCAPWARLIYRPAQSGHEAG
jgi:hypothetical protein